MCGGYVVDRGELMVDLWWSKNTPTFEIFLADLQGRPWEAVD
jgi:hypothetical protein